MEANKRTIEQVIAAIHALDLDAVKVNLMDAEEGEGWSRQRSDHNEREYKRFLILSAKYPDQPIAPGKDVDKFWHRHILDTIRYAQDCENVFGYFLHHLPYVGMHGKEDAAKLTVTAMNTARLYGQEFGQSELTESSYCGAAKISYCGAAKISYCGRAQASQLNEPLNNGRLNIHDRPTLPALA